MSLKLHCTVDPCETGLVTLSERAGRLVPGIASAFGQATGQTSCLQDSFMSWDSAAQPFSARSSMELPKDIDTHKREAQQHVPAPDTPETGGGMLQAVHERGQKAMGEPPCVQYAISRRCLSIVCAPCWAAHI